MTERADALVQWKGTDLCMDFHCTCGTHSHFDGMFCYRYRCPSCGRTWKMPEKLEPVPAEEGDGTPCVSGWTDGEDDHG